MDLTLLMAACFIAQGVFKMALAYSLQGLPSWPAVFVSGFLSLVGGFWIVALLPAGAEWVLGVLFGADLVLTGVTALGTACAAHCGHRILSAESEPLLGENPNV